MAVNQPPIADDPTRAAWEYELTQNINTLEQRLAALEGGSVRAEGDDTVGGAVSFHENFIEGGQARDIPNPNPNGRTAWFSTGTVLTQVGTGARSGFLLPGETVRLSNTSSARQTVYLISFEETIIS